MIINELISYAAEFSKGRVIKDVRAGLGYTCVLLEDGGCGLAYTFRNELGCCCGVMDFAGKIIGNRAEDLIAWANDSDLLKSAIGLATINAVLNNIDKDWEKGNVLQAFSLRETDSFGMIGDFKPILKSIKSMTENIYVFERNTLPNDGLYPAEMMGEYLPRCKVIVITATSLINHTIDDIVKYCNGAEQVCLVGLSTPMCPQVFKDHNITLLAGSLVKDADKILQIVSQGGGTMAMRPELEQVLVPTGK